MSEAQRTGEREDIRDLNIEQELKDSFLTYAVSVLMDRALPDVRDGLKPSQRRILVTMGDLGLTPRGKFRKCAKITGDTFGNYHPHGAAEVIYPTLVRMAQDFSFRYPLVDKQGNFGSVDGDPPAAMRYTEARMRPQAVDMLEDLDKDTVDFRPNFDETTTEPVVLPGKFPNLLCNGTVGIAIGMATSIPPHNVGEVCDAIIHVIDSPEATPDDLMKFVRGPDFPTGAQVCGRKGIVEAYRTGQGKAIVRAQAHTEQTRAGRQNIVFTEIPYHISKSTIKERIAMLVNRGKITGISDLRDESDREGIRLVVELKRAEDPNVVLNQLYKHTPLQDTFRINLLAIDEGRPVTLNLKQLIAAFIRHRFEVIVRRTQFLLARAEARAHIVEGLLIALDKIDQVIETIRKSRDVDTARRKLVTRFKLTELQANAILAMQLQRLTGLERKRVEEEYKALQEKIKYYRDVLAHDTMVYDIIREDMKEVKARYGDGRRTEITSEVEAFDMEDLIAEEDVAVTISHQGYVKRMTLSRYRKQGRGGKGIIGSDTKEGDFIERLLIASTHDYFLFFTDVGKVHWLKVYDIPQLGRQSKGRAIVNLLQLGRGENITAMIPVRSFDEGYLVMATAKGTVKKTVLSGFGHPKRGGIIACGLRKGDRLVGVRRSFGEQDIVLCSEKGKAVRFAESDVRSMGRPAAGVRGIKLAKGDQVVDLVIVSENTTLLTACEHGYGKRTSFDDYPRHRRGGQGVINIKTSRRNGRVVAVRDVHETDDLMMVTASGKIVRTAVASISVIGRSTQGVRLIRLGREDRLVSVASVVKEESVEGESASAAGSGDE
ncbi:MAG: DNA gyrase subunit A [Planctomycetes bacterium SM23_65]|nr:MAG: DNA gyrase subunit A [Planctomycetes bacterium SM23_65]